MTVEELLGFLLGLVVGYLIMFCLVRQARDVIKVLMKRCGELQKPWIPIDEFLKSGFEGWCWVFTYDGFIFAIQYDRNGFRSGSLPFRKDVVTHVMPIHKPGAPR